MIPTTLQIFLFFYFATKLTLASQQLSSSLFNEPPNFKSTMRIGMEMTKKKIEGKSFGAYGVSLEKFLVILTSNFWYCPVLKSFS
jgi:hypothetical protein